MSSLQNPYTVIAGLNHQQLVNLFTAAYYSQTNNGVADWQTSNEFIPTLEMLNSNDSQPFSVKSGQRYSFFESLPGVRRWTRTDIKLVDELPASFSKKCVCIGVFLSSPEPTVEEVKFIDRAAVRVRAGKPLSKRLVIVINDALLKVNFPPPPLDALDQWNRKNIGEDLGEPPMVRVQNMAMWGATLSDLDERWGKRISGLTEQARSRGYEVYILPISLLGFDVRSGLPVDASLRDKSTGRVLDVDTTVSAVAFNIAPLIQLLSPNGGAGLPMFFSKRQINGLA